jgi:hypothetical protein
MTKAETWTFTDYAPLVFKRFRAMCGIDETEYLLALGNFYFKYIYKPKFLKYIFVHFLTIFRPFLY